MYLTEVGINATGFARACGVSYRKADHWCRMDVLCPSIRQADGSGSQRVYSMEDVAVGRVLAELTSLHCERAELRAVVRLLRSLPSREWGRFLLVPAVGAPFMAADAGAALAEDGLTACWVVRLGAVIEPEDIL